jgi:hypothetical protein
VLGHGRERDGEQGQHGTGREIADGRADAADGERERPDPGHDSERRGRGDDQEDDRSGAQDIAAKFGARGCGRGGWGHRDALRTAKRMSFG